MRKNFSTRLFICHAIEDEISGIAVLAAVVLDEIFFFFFRILKYRYRSQSIDKDQGRYT